MDANPDLHPAAIRRATTPRLRVEELGERGRAWAPGVPLLRLRSAFGLVAASALVGACEPPLSPSDLAAQERRPDARAPGRDWSGRGCSAGFACSLDRTTFLRCEGGRMVVHALCRGARQCASDERGVRCDQSVAEMGDACDEGAACSVDLTQMLDCRGGRRVVRSECTLGCEVHKKMKTVECISGRPVP